MTRVSSKLLSLVAVLLGLPATVAVVRGPSLLLPGVLTADPGIPTVLVPFVLPHVVFFGSLVFYSLCHYWLLAIRTTRGLIHPFGKAFWLGLVAALLYSMLEVPRAGPFPGTLVLIWGATLCLLAEQLRLRAAPQSTPAYIAATLITCRPNYPAVAIGIALCLSVGVGSWPRDTRVRIQVDLDDADGPGSRGLATAEFLDERERVIVRTQEDDLRRIFLTTSEERLYLQVPGSDALLQARFVRIGAPGCAAAVVPVEFVKSYIPATCAITHDLDAPIRCPRTAAVFDFRRRVRLDCD